MLAFWRSHILPWLIWAIYKSLALTWRITLVESEGLKRALKEKKTIIFAHWHGDELAIIHLVHHYQIATMTSTSKDGSLVDNVIRRLGGATSRGSSTRGGVSALKGLIRLLKDGHNASMAVDGPKGPLHIVKPGVFELSRLGDAEIVPVGVAASNPHVFRKSWNKAILPKPFSRVVIVFPEPWKPMSREVDIRSPELAGRLAQSLSDAHHQASKLIAR